MDRTTKELLAMLEDLEDILAAQIAMKRGEFVDWEDVKKELGL